MALTTPLCGLLGCRAPILQTAMGWVADPALVAASVNAGAFGFLAGATIPVERLEQDICRVKELSTGPFGVNFHMFQPGAQRVVELVVSHGVRAVSYGRGPLPRMIRTLKDAGVLCIPTVGLRRHAEKAVQLGADIIVAQGAEGGGHTGSVATSILLPQVVEAVPVPVVGAGGFHSGAGLVAALAYGAEGIAMGSRFLLTRESPVPRETLQRYLEEQDPARVVVSPALDGLPQRMVRNEMLDRLEGSGWLRKLWIALGNALRYRKFTGASIPQLLRGALAMRRDGLSLGQAMMAANAPMIIQEAMVHGRPERGVLPGGQVVGRIDSLLSCQELVDGILGEAEACLAQLDALQERG